MVEEGVVSGDTKVLFLARWYPDRYDPMPGIFIKRHAQVAAGIAETAVLYLRAVPDKGPVFEFDHVVEEGVFTLRVYYGVKFNLPILLSKPLSIIQFIRAFVKGYGLLNKLWGKPNLVHVNVLTRLGILAWSLKFFQGIDYVITEHWSRYLPATGSYKGFFRKLITKFIVSQAKAVSTVSENLAHAMQNHGLKNKHYLILPNVVDTEIFKPADGYQRKIKRFVHISCFEEKSKNISGLLRIIKRLSDKREDFECLLVGDGVDHEKMQKLAIELNLSSERVIFAGLLEGQALTESYQSSLFNVMFSNYENMPVVISESFACGLPVIATAVGGIPEIISSSNGILVQPCDEDGLYTAIDNMLDNYEQYDRLGIQARAIEKFGKAAVKEKLKELYFIN